MKKLLFLSTTTLLMLFFTQPSMAQTFDEIEDKVEKYIEETKEVYRLDEEGLQHIWEAYCGELDPFENESSQYASEIGRQMLEREKGKVDDLLNRAPSLKESLKPWLENEETDDKAEDLVEMIDDEVEKLNQLKKGGVLMGVDHPFVRFAIQYGIDRHREMCDDYGDYQICDKNFDGVDGRPDVVYVDDSDGLVIVELKPDNDKAEAQGWRQLERYMPDIVDFFEKCFPNGRNGEIVVISPATDNFLKTLQKSDAAWDSDGKQIECRTELKTYNKCDKKFN